MFKSPAFGCAAFPLGFLVFLLGWLFGEFRVGVLLGILVSGGLLLAAVFTAINSRGFSRLDILLPIPIAAAWSLLLSVFSLGADIFAAPACIGSAVLLSAALWMIKRQQMPRSWAIVPLVVFFYEMLPLKLPGAVDDYLAFGGSMTDVLIQAIVARSMRKPPPSQDQG